MEFQYESTKNFTFCKYMLRPIVNNKKRNKILYKIKYREHRADEISQHVEI